MARNSSAGKEGHCSVKGCFLVLLLRQSNQLKGRNGCRQVQNKIVHVHLCMP